jgi:tRNA-splicing ligase RtcB
MLVDGIVYATPKLMESGVEDGALLQVANVACLPGIVRASFAMPDIHFGYGFAIGGVAAMSVSDGVVSPGGVGYDINCGVRLMRTDLHLPDVQDRLDVLISECVRSVPAGVGGGGGVSLNESAFADVCRKGAAWAVTRGHGDQDDLDRTEAGGCLPGADPDAVSARARSRAVDQLGTLGSGNHFLEIQVVDEVLDPEAARAFDLDEEGQIAVMIHCGSRGFGHQVCDDHIGLMQRAVGKYGIRIPDRQLGCAPVTSPEGEHYLAAMACAANYAWANRQVILHRVRGAFERVFGVGAGKLGLRQVYDVAHNIAKLETHIVDGTETPLCVHRKGATRAFPPGHADVPPAYRAVGQPVLVPGDMGSPSYVLAGTDQAYRDTFGSTCHGAGRAMSRSKAKQLRSGREVIDALAERGIIVKAKSPHGAAEEQPDAYKDVDEVVAAVVQAGLARPVVRLRPLAVMKG